MSQAFFLGVVQRDVSSRNWQVIPRLNKFIAILMQIYYANFNFHLPKMEAKQNWLAVIS